MNLKWSNVTIQLQEISVIFNLNIYSKNWIPRRTFMQSLDAILLENN
jgi:hypothetical protein